jgi:hypothetical protein
MRLFLAIALPTLTLAAAAGVYVFKPAALPQQLAPELPRAMQPISVTSFRNRWDGLGHQAAASRTSNAGETVAGSPGPIPLAEDLPRQIETPSPLIRKRSARLGGRGLCARHGLRRVDYQRSGHLYWRCA